MSNPVSPVEMLTSDVVVVAFSFLNFQDLIASAQVSREFRTCAAEEGLWKSLTCDRFGSRLVEETLPLYQNDYRAMMLDDNQKGALPTLLNVSPSNWFANVPDRYYCCHIPCIKWDRVANNVLLYFDVIGENDLRHPGTSSIQCMPANPSSLQPQLPAVTTIGALMQRQRQGAINHPATECHMLFEYRESQLRGRLHYQGYLVFPGAIFNTHGTYTFCFATQLVWALHRDYEAVPVVTIAAGERGISTSAFEREGGDNRELYFTGHEPPLELSGTKNERSNADANIETQASVRGNDEIQWFHPRPPF